MIVRLALCALLGACSVPTAPVAPVVTKATPPAELASCPTGAPVPKALPRVRTVDHIAAGYNNVEGARETTARALATCSSRLIRLNEWIEQHDVTTK